MKIHRQLMKVKIVTISVLCFSAIISYHQVAYGQCGGTGGTPSPGCPGAEYRPSAYVDSGGDPTNNPTTPYTGGYIVGDEADVNASTVYTDEAGTYTADVEDGDCTWSGFPSYTSPTALTLHIPYYVTNQQPTLINIYTVILTIGTSSTWIYNYTLNDAGEITATIPAGTDLSTISVRIWVNTGGDDGSGLETDDSYANMYLDMYIS